MSPGESAPSEIEAEKCASSKGKRGETSEVKRSKRAVETKVSRAYKRTSGKNILEVDIMENVLEMARKKFESAERGLESAKSRYKRQLLTRDTYDVLEASYVGQMKALYPIIKRLESLQAK